MKIFYLVLIILGLSACTDANFEKLTNFGGSASIVCYSGELIIYDGKSSGKVLSEANSDGYYFKDASTGALMEVSGNCIITYD